MDRPKLFMDSGAYSAKTKGVTISLKSYAKFLKEFARYIDVPVGLDVIHDPEQTWANIKEMEALGCTVLPTFHTREDPKWLRRYVEEYDYIGLGGGVGLSPPQRKMWFDELWGKYLTDEQGRPVCRVHGFGITGLDMMKRYPWFSVDSTSWLMGAAMGRAVVNLNGEMHSLSVSEDSNDIHSRNTHLDTLPPDVQTAFIALVNKAGFERNEVRTDYKKRFVLNAIAYTEMARSIQYHTFQNEQQDIWVTGEKFVSKQACAPWDRLTVYLAGNPGASCITEQLMLRGYDRLLSYHYINEGKHWDEARSVLDGWGK